MNDKKPADERKTRLAQALRENLKRRKSQARARSSAGPASAEPEAGAVNPPQIPPRER